MQLSFEHVLYDLKPLSRFQFTRVLLLNLVALYSSIHAYTTIFTLPAIDQTCFVADRYLAPYDELSEKEWRLLAYPSHDSACSVYDFLTTAENEEDLSNNVSNNGNTSYSKCDRYIISEDDGLTATADFELFCGDAQWRSTANSVFFIGGLAGTVLSGQLADVLGRKPVLIVTQTVAVLAALCTALSRSYLSFLVCRFFSGIGYNAAYPIAITLMCEMMVPSHTTLIGMGYEVFTGIGLALLGFPISFFLQSWRALQIAVFFIGLPVLGVCCVCSESLRWLLVTQRLRRAEKLTRKISYVNQVMFDKAIRDKLHHIASEKKEDPSEKQGLLIVQIFRTPNLRGRIVILSYIWICSAMVYFGLSLSAAAMPGSSHVNAVISGLVVIPAMSLGYFLNSKLGRKRLLSGFFILSGFGCVPISLIYSYEGFYTQILAHFSKFCITIVYGTIVLYSLEIIPTCARGTGISICVITSRLGSAFTPYILALNQVWQPLGFLVYGLLSISAGFVILLLPETYKKPMPDSFREAAGIQIVAELNPVKEDDLVDGKSEPSATDA